MNKKIIPLACWLIPLQSFAAIELTDNLSLSGFGSTSWATSDNEVPVLINRNIDDSNCFDCDTTFGLQFDFYYDSFKASAQLVKRPQDEWSSPELEWAYLGYEWEDFEFRAGRLRLPLFLASEYYYVGHAYTYARPPTEIYNSVLGITAFNGLSLNWNYDINDEMTLSLTPFVGFNDENKVQFDPTFRLEFETNGLYGFNSQLSGENYRINLALLQSNYDVTAVQITPYGTFSAPDEDIDVTFYSLGGEYFWNKARFSLEMQKNEKRGSWYAGADYNLDKFTPYVIYGQTYNDKDKAGNSYTIGVRYDLMYNISINAEWQYLSSFNGSTGPFVKPLPPGVDFDQSSANLYTIMVNFVF
ncbi:sulfate ABC transporter permease [Vibrio agarivorans]|uniref:Sulfate ABC transporter permease n=1 Tax=Vibrio agarivorans TaxID=153622 RepID=A0ABT7Y4V8_9VIBR|nr:sulfate ABC transporter permease [Vibrio agarivorans]MDN2483083.1 sulfate ABC transporter permease [Vibrio agarivorans]